MQSGGSYSRQYYYSYGAPRTTEGTLPTDFTFTGQKFDASDGLMYYGARYYDAALGRFISADTVIPDPKSPEGLNRYAYVFNNPLKYSDPTGHCPKPPSNSGSVICFEGFIPTRYSTAIPGLKTYTGDDRSFSSDSCYKCSRFWVWIDTETGNIGNPEGEPFVNETCPATGDCLQPDKVYNKITSTKNPDSSITVEYEVRCAEQPFCAFGPEGKVTFTPNKFDNFDTKGKTEAFPNLAAYHYRNGERVSTLFEWEFFSEEERTSGTSKFSTGLNMASSEFSWSRNEAAPDVWTGETTEITPFQVVPF